jgi:hypothetical protein
MSAGKPAADALSISSRGRSAGMLALQAQISEAVGVFSGGDVVGGVGGEEQAIGD